MEWCRQEECNLFLVRKKTANHEGAPKNKTNPTTRKVNNQMSPNLKVGVIGRLSTITVLPQTVSSRATRGLYCAYYDKKSQLPVVFS